MLRRGIIVIRLPAAVLKGTAVREGDVKPSYSRGIDNGIPHRVILNGKLKAGLSAVTEKACKTIKRSICYG